MTSFLDNVWNRHGPICTSGYTTEIDSVAGCQAVPEKKRLKKKQLDFQNKQIYIQKKSLFSDFGPKKKWFFHQLQPKNCNFQNCEQKKKKKKKNYNKFFIICGFGFTVENILSHNKIEFWSKVNTFIVIHNKTYTNI